MIVSLLQLNTHDLHDEMNIFWHNQLKNFGIDFSKEWSSKILGYNINIFDAKFNIIVMIVTIALNTTLKTKQQ